MLLGFQLKKGAVEFSKIENEFFRYFFEILQKEMPRECCWLSDDFFKDLKFMWAPAMTENAEAGIMGCWGPDSPDKVYVAPPANVDQMAECEVGDSAYATQHPEWRFDSEIEDKRSYLDLDFFFSSITGPLTLTHECYHRWQFKQYPILYCINRLFTLFVDNPILDAIFIKKSERKAMKEMQKGNYEYTVKEEDNHLPFLYKLTLEYDADRSTDHNPEMQKIVQTLVDLYFNYSGWVRTRYTADVKTAQGVKRNDLDDNGKPMTWYQDNLMQCYADALNNAETKYLNYVMKLFNIATDYIFETRYKFNQN